MPDATTILEEAQRIVYGKREEEYGAPRDNWGDTAKAMTAYLHATGKLARDKELDAHDGAMLMQCVKLCRQGHRRQRDNLVDIAGYAEVADRTLK